MNDAVGAKALLNNVDGFQNNAFGESALIFNIHSANNTAIGDVALAFNDSSGNGLGNNNTAVGGAALFNNVDGFLNTAVGAAAGLNVINGLNNTYIGDFVGSLAPDESDTIRIADFSQNGFGSAACFIGGIFNNFQPVNGANIVQVTLDLTNDHLGWDFGPSNQPHSVPSRSAPLRRSAPAQRPAMLNGKVGKVEKLEATVAQQQKQIETLTAQLKEQAETFTAQLKEQASPNPKSECPARSEKTCAARGQQSLELCPSNKSKPYFTISRHASPCGGFLFSAFLSLLFELPLFQIMTNAVRLNGGGPNPFVEIIGSYNGRGAGVGRALGVGVSLGVGVGEDTANAYTLLSPAT